MMKKHLNKIFLDTKVWLRNVMESFCVGYPKVENSANKISDESVIDNLIENSIWAVGYHIDFVNDILAWVNDKLEDLLEGCAIEVNVIKGSDLADFIIKRNESKETNASSIETMKKSVILAVLDNYGNIIDDQMIRSNGGISSKANQQFNGQPMIKIKIPA